MSNKSGPSRLLNNGSQNKPIKRHSAFEEVGEEEENDGMLRNRNGRWKEETISGFSSSSYEDEERRRRKQSASDENLLVIAKQEDVNWMEERKKRLGLEKYRKELGSLSGGFGVGNGARREGEQKSAAKKDRIGDDEQKIGLEVRNPLKEQDGDSEMIAEPEQIPSSQKEAKEELNASEDEDAAARTALMSGSIETQQNINLIITPISEEEALQRDMDSRPDEPTLSDYSKMPVDAFGAALLRGMGWKEGMGAGKQRQGPTSAPQVQRRAALLGLGAKEREKDESNSSKRPERKYVPVSKRENESGRREEDSSIRSKSSRDRSYSPPSSRHRRYEEDKDERRSRRYEEDERRREKGSSRDKYHRDGEAHKDRRYRDDHRDRYHYDDGRYDRDRKSSRR